MKVSVVVGIILFAFSVLLGLCLGGLRLSLIQYLIVIFLIIILAVLSMIIGYAIREEEKEELEEEEEIKENGYYLEIDKKGKIKRRVPIEKFYGDFQFRTN